MPKEPSTLEYIIERESTIRVEDITEELRDVAWFRPGHVLIELLRRSCAEDQADCGAEAWDALQVYVRPQGDRWEIVDWRGDSDPDAPPEIPDAFRAPRP